MSGPESADERERFRADLEQGWLTAAQIQLMFEALRKRLKGAPRRDFVAVEFRLDDLRIRLMRLAERAEGLLGVVDLDKPASEADGTPPARMH